MNLNKTLWIGLLLVLSSVRLTMAADISLTTFQPHKLLYTPSETGTVDALVTSTRNAPATVTLTVTFVREFTPVATLPPVTVTLQPKQTNTVAIPFTAATEEYGWTVIGELKEGDTSLDRKVDVFNVADNVLKVGVGASFEMMQPSGFGWLKPEDDIKRARQYYMNTWEKFFWAPCDWADLCPTNAEWSSGQTGRYEVGAKITTLIRLCKDNGIRSITYSQPTSAGPRGWEVARRHPEWFHLDTLGRPAGEWDQEDLLYWDTRYEMQKKHGNDESKWPHRFRSNWLVLYPNFSRVDTLDYGIDRLLDGALQWGWDGVRFDGNWGAGDDETSTRNFQRMKARIWAKRPDFVFGYNDDTPGKEPAFAASHEYRERMAGYGECMDEMIRQWEGRDHGSPFTYKQWRDYAEGMCADVDACRKANGIQYAILDARNTYYKFVLAMAAGIHTCYGDHFTAAGSPNWGRLLPRWSGLVYDVHLTRLDPKGKLDVKTAGNLWWDKWVSERIVSSNRFQRIVSLIVPPANLSVTNDERGVAVENVTVTTKATGNGTLAAAWLIDTTRGDEPQKLEIATAGESATVVVPRVTGWSLVVWEFTGQYIRPENGPRTTEPFDPKQVERAALETHRPAPKDPIRPDDDPTKSGALTVREAEALPIFVAGTTTIADPKASGGFARRRDGTASNTSGCFGQSTYANLSPGRYRATYRFAIEDKTKWSGIALRYSYNATDVMPLELNPDSFQASGVYQDFSYEFTYLGPGTLGIDGFFRGQNGPGALRFDKVTLELLKAFGDTDIEAAKRSGPLSPEWVPGTPLPPPLDAKAPSLLPSLDEAETAKAEDAAHAKALAAALATYRAFAKAPVRVLVVAGLHANLYGLEKAFPPEWHIKTVFAGQNERTGAYVAGLPSADELFQYHVVLLANVDGTALGFNTRRLLRHFVHQGGGLFVLGGMQALGQGSYRESFLGELLPLTLAPSRDVQPFDQPALLKSGTGTLLSGLDLKSAGGLFMRHRVEPKTNATIQLVAGAEPVLFTADAGKGRVAVFTGTVMGGPSTPGQGFAEPAPAAPAFWMQSAWPQIVNRVTAWVAAPSQALDHTPDPNRKLVITPKMVSANWLCSLSDGQVNGVEKLAVDGNLSTGVRRTGDGLGIPGANLEIDLGTPHFVRKVRLASTPNRDLIAPPEEKGWGQPGGPTLLRGSDSGTSWTTLATLPSVGADMEAAWYDFPTTAATNRAFRFIQLYGGQFTLSELEVWGRPAAGEDAW